MGWREYELEAVRHGCQIALQLFGSMRRMIIEKEPDLFALWVISVQFLKKLDELACPMPVADNAVDAAGAAIYHTNVLMAIGTGFAVVCSESIVNDAHRAAVLSKLGTTGHAIVEITAAQMAQFAGNILELAAPKGRIIALSTTALGCLGAAQRRALESRATLIPAQIPTIERVGGGGVRCMLAEIHLPKKAPGS